MTLASTSSPSPSPRGPWRAVGGAAVIACLLAAGCAPSTRVAIRNETDGPITVALRSAEAQTSMRLSDVPSKAASPLQTATLSSRRGLVVEVRDGDGQSGRVALRDGEDNIIVIRGDRPPRVFVLGEPEPADDDPATAAPEPIAAPPPPPPPPPEHEPDHPLDPPDEPIDI